MSTVMRVREFRRNEKLFSAPAHAAGENVAHAQIAADLLRLHAPSFVGHHGSVGRYSKIAKSAEGCGEVFSHPIAEIFLRRITA